MAFLRAKPRDAAYDDGFANRGRNPFRCEVAVPDEEYALRPYPSFYRGLDARRGVAGDYLCTPFGCADDGSGGGEPLDPRARDVAPSDHYGQPQHTGDGKHDGARLLEPGIHDVGAPCTHQLP